MPRAASTASLEPTASTTTRFSAENRPAAYYLLIKARRITVTRECSFPRDNRDDYARAGRYCARDAARHGYFQCATRIYVEWDSPFVDGFRSPIKTYKNRTLVCGNVQVFSVYNDINELQVEY